MGRIQTHCDVAHTFEQDAALIRRAMTAALQKQTAAQRFGTLLDTAQRAWDQRQVEEGTFSIAVQVPAQDPLKQLPCLAGESSFRFLWDSAPGLCLAAAGQCQHLELAGPRRFELAQRFSDTTLQRLIDASPKAPCQARSRVLLAFSFFEQSREQKGSVDAAPCLQALLPRWQLSSHGQESWLRMHGHASDASDVRALTEALWQMAEALNATSPHDQPDDATVLGTPVGCWQERYQPALEQGLALVNEGALHKLVLAVRQSIELTTPLSPLPLLERLRHQQTGSCRFLWQRGLNDAFFGASPERLLNLRNGRLRSDALAGTAGRGEGGDTLMQSSKDRHEHELVVKAISESLREEGLRPQSPRQPQLARHGHLIHLHTPISADASGHQALALAAALHPTPAVAGLPRREAMHWLQTLEPFERGGYAAPIGWIDKAGDAELRVAIRCGHLRGNQLDLTAGAGLVRGSIAERELQEVSQKLAVLADQLDLHSGSGERTQTPLHR
jgi:menaquinone-specific isochorismate synthase